MPVIQHVHHDYDEAVYDGLCPVTGTCEDGREGCLGKGQCQVDPYDIDVNAEANYRILCKFCASEIADDI